MSNAELDKGGAAEELIRKYFLDMSSYVVRGIKVHFNEFEITDIDLWVYLRPSPFQRSRFNIDIKNKKTPQAAERIFWAKGVQSTLNLEDCIVATTDKRNHIKEFGRQYGVTVFDGNFLESIKQKYIEDNSRLSEEEFISVILPHKEDKQRSEWVQRIEISKSRLLSKLNFDGCNSWLIDCSYFLDKFRVSNHESAEATCRAFYLMISYFLVGLDFTSQRFVLENAKTRENVLDEGFKYGDLGVSRYDKTVSMVVSLNKAIYSGKAATEKEIRQVLQSSLDSLPVNILCQYFSNSDVLKELFNLAKKFESLAYSKDFIAPKNLEPKEVAVLGVLLDYNKVERKKFFAN